jgi:hypothetical protein
MLFKSLDFVYMPSKDVDADLKYYAEVLGAETVFNITDMGTQVAQVKLGEGPRLLLAGHLEGEVPILVYRVENLKQAMKELKARGWKKQQEVELPHGPCATFVASGGQRFAIYQLVRPEADQFLTRK